ncbi:MAG: hypothetical protein SNJ66_09980 [Chloroherpetonaceae bacterium]
MKRNFTALPILVFAVVTLVTSAVFSCAFSPPLLAQNSDSSVADSLLSNAAESQFDSTLDSTIKRPPTFKASTPTDSIKFYKILPPVPSLFATPYHALDSMRDFAYHRHVEDYFAPAPNFFFRDKVELGQQNDLLVGGLGTRYQAIYLDDILLNDVISAQAFYNHLSSESFSELNLFGGYTAFGLSASPIALESKTQTIVAAKGYTKAHYYQFSGSTNKMDITFALNLSERWSFYGGYVREGAEGIFRNSGGFGGDRFGSSSEANKLRLRFRYQYGVKTYFNFALERNSLNLKPFGGANLFETTRLGGDIFSPINTIIANEFVQRKNVLSLYKVELQTALPFIPKRFQADSLNLFKAWVAFTEFSNTVEQRRDNMFRDFESASRLTLGATQSLKLLFFSLGLRGAYSLESVGENNTLANANAQPIKPNLNTVELTASAKTSFPNLIFGEALELGASLASTTKSITNTFGQNFTTSFLSTGVGGEVNFPLVPSREAVLKVFMSLSTTSRVPSLREVFSSTDVKGAQAWQNERVSQAEFGSELRYTDAIRLRLSLLSSLVSSPYAVVQRRTSDTTLALRYQSLQSSTLSYSGVGLAIQSKIGKIESHLNATLVLDYSLFSNPDNAFTGGLQLQGDTIDARSGRVLYVPRVYANGGIYFRSKLFDGALNLKLGIMGYVQTDLSAALQNSERQSAFFFNLIEQNGTLRDNNLQFGTLRPKATLDAQIWAGIGSGMIFFFIENVFDTSIFRAPFFPMYARAFRLGVNWEILD